MENNNLEIFNAVYVGVCMYSRLRKSIVEIEGKFVSLEDKKELGLYLGILHSNNSINSLLKETELVKDTKINYNRLISTDFCEQYNLYFKDLINSINAKTIEEYFVSLLDNEIIKKLNNEYNFNPFEYINYENKQLIKK